MIHACEHHDEVLALWRREDRRDVRLVHVDFHDDMRGLLVDRRRGRAYAIGALARGADPLDEGNFLAHAVLEGRVRSVRWVHGVPGGRAWDAGVVRYESDRLAWPARLGHRLRRGREVELEFEERTLDAWDGLRQGECLSIDWDCFASVLLDRAGIGRRVESFLGRLGDAKPSDTWLVWSPEYSHPGFDGYRALAAALSARLAQPVAWSSPRLERGESTPRGRNPCPPRGPLMRVVLALRRLGFY